MGKIGKAGVLAGLALTALVFSGSAPMANATTTDFGERGVAAVCDQSGEKEILLARGGKGKGGRWANSDNSSGSGGYGVQDGSAAAPRPQDGTGYGAKKGSGTGACDGTGPKGKGRGGR